MEMRLSSAAGTILCLLLHIGVSVVLSACPNGISGNCECSEAKEGFYVDCREVNHDLNTVLAPIEKIHLERLSVIGAYWPKLKRLPKLSVRTIQFVNCGIEEIEEAAFDSVAEHLEELVLSNNSLTSVPYFGNMQKLLSLNLKFNKINDVPDRAFRNMSNLVQLRLDGNRICRMPRSALKDVRNTVELLDLSGNCLEHVPGKNLKNLPRLMYLDLSDNRITGIGDFEFSNLPVLKELRLNNNQLSEIATLAFKDVPRLKHMYLQDNYLTEFDTSAMIEGFRKLEVLDISNNRLQAVPVLKELANIVQVRLEHNKISRIDSYTFSGNHRLRHLSLQDNEITSLAPHSFSRLHGLTHLLLGNNALRFIEQDVFCGMENLEQLSLQNNSLNELDNHTFMGIPSLKMLDLSYNGLHRIAVGTFKPLERVMYIDLSHNVITSFEKGTFDDPIPNIILFGNPIVCDDKLDWFVQYLLVNRIRTHLPFQSDVMCAAPEKYTNVRLRDFLARKANETFSALKGAFRMATGGSSGQNVVNNLIPASIRKFMPGLERTENNPYSNVPVIGAITKTLPGLRSLPGLRYLPKATGEKVEEVQSLNNAIEKFSSPLIRVATGESETLSDIDQMVKAIPELAANLPGAKDVDLSKLPPSVLLHVLHGGQIPGVEKETLERILRQHTSRMYQAALASKVGHPLLDEARYLPPLEKFPKEIVEEMMKGKSLPYLTPEQMYTIKGYYIKQVAASINSGNANAALPEGIITPQLKSMLKLLPPGYDISKIPVEVLETVAEGKIPDLNALPSDLQDFILNGRYGPAGKNTVDSQLSVDDVLRGLANTDAPSIPDFERYDINKVSVDLIKAEEEASRKERLRLYSTVLLCVVAVLSTVVIFLLIMYMKRRRILLADKKLQGLFSPNRTPVAEVLLPRRSRSSLTAERPQASRRTSGERKTIGRYDVISPVK